MVSPRHDHDMSLHSGRANLLVVKLRVILICFRIAV